MISGFLMMNTLFRQDEKTRLANNSTAQFVFRKYCGVFLPLLFSAISGFLIYELLVYPDPKQDTFLKIPQLFFEILPMQTLGFKAFYSTGVSWYLSALLIGVALLHPMAKRNPERFAYTVCPTAALLGYGFLCYNGGHLDQPCTWFLGFVNSGIVRSISGLCAGCVLFVLCRKTDPTKKVSILPRIGFSALALIGWYCLYCDIANKKLVRTEHDFFLAAILFAVLYLELSEKTMLSFVFRHRWTKVLSTISRYVFLNHYAWSRYFIIKHKNLTAEEALPWYLLCIATSSVVVWLLTCLVKLAIRGIQKIKTKKSDKELSAV